jgi:Uma2 family endonuclease
VSHARNFVIRENNGVVGAPDLIVEILSKGTAAKDRGDKKEVYEQFAVKEYWIVDPAAQSIEIYSFDTDRYRLVSFAAEDGTVQSGVLTGLELDVSTLF